MASTCIIVWVAICSCRVVMFDCLTCAGLVWHGEMFSGGGGVGASVVPRCDG